MKIEDIAKTCHEVNRAYCQAIGDDSQPPWEEAPEWMKSSALNGVHFHIANPSAGPESSHNHWMEERIRTGWKYGPEKDPDKKEHPCIVPFNDLPASQKVKDYLFRAVVHSLTSVLVREG